jgi:hypothetical protein
MDMIVTFLTLSLMVFGGAGHSRIDETGHASKWRRSLLRFKGQAG